MLKRLKQLNLAENKIEKIGKLPYFKATYYFCPTEFTIKTTLS